MLLADSIQPVPAAMALASFTSSLHLNGEDITLRVRHNPRARRMILRIDHTSGEVVVTSPTKRAMKDAALFAAKESRWIEEHLAKMPDRIIFADRARLAFRGEDTIICHRPDKRRGVWHDQDLHEINVSGDPEFLGRRLEDFLRREAKRDLLHHVALFAARLGAPLPKVTVRDTATRWGSCSSSGALSFSWRLILAPPAVLAYVAAHECAHLRHHNHSKAFWALVHELDGGYQESEAWMSRHASDLFRYGPAKPQQTTTKPRIP